jgi:2-keto-4-pentenoate hydratase
MTTTDLREADRAVLEAAQRLAAAGSSGVPCQPVRSLLPAGDLHTAYAVQTAHVTQRLANGAAAVGRKIGLTNPAVQTQLGVDQPDFGVLFDDMNCSSGEAIDASRTLQPRIEAEIAFILNADLDSESIGVVEVVAATGHVVAALEIVDSRIAGWDISIVDTIADNASSGLFVLGHEPRVLADLDLAACAMTMHRGGDLVSEGTGVDCLGSPLIAVAWLANTARDYGRPLRAGDIVLSGALGPMVAVQPGDKFEATISGLGTVSATFAPSLATTAVKL